MFLANFRVAYDVLVPGALARPGTGLSPDYAPRASPAGSPAFSGNLRAAGGESFVCPGVVAIPLDARTDAEITLLANLITLTPGSVTLDLSEDLSVLHVHAMYIDGGDVEAYRADPLKKVWSGEVLELLR